jgi:hypothetical protein
MDSAHLPRFLPASPIATRKKKEGRVWIRHDYWVVRGIQLKGERKTVWYHVQFGRVRIDSHVFMVFHSILAIYVHLHSVKKVELAAHRIGTVCGNFCNEQKGHISS